MKFVRHHHRGDAPQLNTPVLDRRSCPRGSVRSPEATLRWSSALAESAVEARVVNLSRGGAGLLVREAPPTDAILRLVLSRSRGVVIEGWVVGVRDQPDDEWQFVHMRFSHDCPGRILDSILDDPMDDE
ncbi:PilZ domain-containing protein [Planctomyces sp. SH-PL62]|uniref:PilZ domain-containing protein n=1 Tax=Planctomyces sp. SH-PL62 TaxID=1636152 RepID=UPI00078E4B38|nr:PilZ domain-containing protein [Planctomyces sp. SH-PL62]AMV36574.1 PilZ domain protein [Planctomyces sp. SH-PL62]